MKHVLVPLDGSLSGENALCRAEELLGGTGKITLLTAIDAPEIPLYGYDLVGVTSAPSYQESLEQVMARASAYLGKIAERLQSKGYHTDTVVQFSEPATLIVDAADAHHVDVIVMSTRGRSGISRWLFGSVTSRVLTLAHCPVLVVPCQPAPCVIRSGFADVVR